MAIKDYWVYQKRDCATPWALYIVKEYDKRKPDATSLDLTIYSEDIDEPTHSKSFVNIKHERVSGYVDDIVEKLSNFCHVYAQDYQQLQYAIEDILFS